MVLIRISIVKNKKMMKVKAKYKYTKGCFGKEIRYHVPLYKVLLCPEHLLLCNPVSKIKVKIFTIFCHFCSCVSFCLKFNYTYTHYLICLSAADLNDYFKVLRQLLAFAKLFWFKICTVYRKYCL